MIILKLFSGNGLQKYQSRWSLAIETYSLNAAIDNNGNVVADPDEAAKIFKDYWIKVFCRKDVDIVACFRFVHFTSPS